MRACKTCTPVVSDLPTFLYTSAMLHRIALTILIGNEQGFVTHTSKQRVMFFIIVFRQTQFFHRKIVFFIWKTCVVSSGSVWFHLVRCGFISFSVWFHLVFCGFIWFFVVSSGFLWFHLVFCGFIWFVRFRLVFLLFGVEH